jgi:hypothetical protein
MNFCDNLKYLDVGSCSESLGESSDSLGVLLLMTHNGNLNTRFLLEELFTNKNFVTQDKTRITIFNMYHA